MTILKLLAVRQSGVYWNVNEHLDDKADAEIVVQITLLVLLGCSLTLKNTQCILCQ